MTNWKRCWYCRIILYVLAVTVGELQTHGPCNNTQYIELGKPGIVQCSFEAGMYGIYWYDSEDVTTQRPFFFYESSKKSGQGYTSGEFDVEPNGSLVIHNVTFKHDHVYTVACLANKDGQAVSVRVTVAVIVKPTQLHPLVSQCYGENNCYRLHSEAPNLNCFVTGSRPAVRLRWFRRTIHSDQKLPSEKSVHNLSNSVFSTYANLSTVLVTVNHYAVFVCKASSVPPMLPITESIVLLERELEYSFPNTEQKCIEEGAKMTLDCLAGNDFIVVWKKRAKANFETVVGLVSEKLLFRSSEYDVNREKSLVLNKTSIHQEGMYVCFHSDGISTTGTLYNITVYIYPVPNYPVVEGCGSHTPCVIVYESRQGELTCKLLGIRPVVSLKWRIADENLLEKLTFFDEVVTVSPNAKTYDVVVTAQFSLRDKSISKITVECFPFGKLADVINIPTKKVDLTFSSETSEIKADLIALPLSWLILLVMATPVLLALGYGGLLLKGKINGLFKRKGLKKQPSPVLYSISQDNSTETTEETPLTSMDNIDSSMTNSADEKFAKLRDIIGLSKLYELDGNELSDIFKISQQIFDTQPASLRFLELLNSNDSSAVMVLYQTGEAEATALDLQKDDKVISFVQDTTESNILQQSECNVSCRDILFIIYHSCKPSFRQEVVSKMSNCNIAVPFLLPSPVDRDKITFLFSDLQRVKKEWVGGESFGNVTVTKHAFPTVAAMRIGDIGVSKSKILNLIIGSVQHEGNPPKFLASSEDVFPSPWSRGTVEAVWFLPTKPIEIQDCSLCTATCFLNLRGGIGMGSSKLQEDFLFSFSSCVIIFVEKSSYDDHYDSLVSEWSEETHVILVVLSDKYNRGQVSSKILRKGDCLTVIIFQRCSEMKIAREISKQIVLSLKEDKKTKTLEKEGRQICKNLSIHIE